MLGAESSLPFCDGRAWSVPADPHCTSTRRWASAGFFVVAALAQRCLFVSYGATAFPDSITLFIIRRNDHESCLLMQLVVCAVGFIMPKGVPYAYHEHDRDACRTHPA